MYSLGFGANLVQHFKKEPVSGTYKVIWSIKWYKMTKYDYIYLYIYIATHTYALKK